MSSASRFDTTAAGYRRLSLWLALAGLVAFFLGDIQIISTEPGREMGRLALGLLTPDFSATDNLVSALAMTLAFAFEGVAMGVAGGFLLALAWRFRLVRSVAAVIRAVHELFWGLIFLQVFGLSPLTGILAIGLPYIGIFAKVFGELLEEADPQPAAALPRGAGALSRLLFARLPLVWASFCSYSRYRLECGIRSSAILGFIGLPTVGFHLETAFRQGDYSAGAALFYLLLTLILTLRWWLRFALVPVYLIAALVYCPPLPARTAGTLWHFISVDIIPAPLRREQGLEAFSQWGLTLMQHQGLPGLWNTLLLGTAALLLTGALALLLVPTVSRQFGNRGSRIAGHLLLVFLRSTPEFLLAFILLLVLGPSMLPGILALSLHTAAIVAHLSAQASNQLSLRSDHGAGPSLYGFEVLPRVYPTFLAFLLYRWEIIMRETAILGILGIHTLGFYVDSAFAEFRLDRAMTLILLGVLLNLGVDALSRYLRGRLRQAGTARAHRDGEPPAPGIATKSLHGL